MIDLLLPLSIGVSFGLKELLQIIQSDEYRKPRVSYLLIPAIVFISLGAINKKNIISGWGYLSRGKITAAVSFIQANVPPQSQIIAPHYIAAEAKRKKLIDYRELLGPYLWMVRTIDTNGYSSLKNQKQFKSWKIMVRQTIPLWFSTVEEAVRSNNVDAIIWGLSLSGVVLFSESRKLFRKSKWIHLRFRLYSSLSRWPVCNMVEKAAATRQQSFICKCLMPIVIISFRLGQGFA